MNEQRFKDAVGFFEHRKGELYEDRWREQGKPEFVDITDIDEQALKEAWEVYNG